MHQPSGGAPGNSLIQVIVRHYLENTNITRDSLTLQYIPPCNITPNSVNMLKKNIIKNIMCIKTKSPYPSRQWYISIRKIILNPP